MQTHCSTCSVIMHPIHQKCSLLSKHTFWLSEHMSVRVCKREFFLCSIWLWFTRSAWDSVPFPPRETDYSSRRRASKSSKSISLSLVSHPSSSHYTPRLWFLPYIRVHAIRSSSFSYYYPVLMSHNLSFTFSLTATPIFSSCTFVISFFILCEILSGSMLHSVLMTSRFYIKLLTSVTENDEYFFSFSFKKRKRNHFYSTQSFSF